MLNGTLKPYLAYSAAGHVGLVLAFAGVLARGRLHAPQQVYRIDFIGSTAGILNREKDSAPPAAAKPAPPARGRSRPSAQKDPDAFNLKKRRRSKPLPKPSLLGSEEPAPEAPQPEAPAAAVPAASAPAEAANPSGTGSGAASASVSADMPNFPYPWYLTRLRASLWDRWSARMPDSSSDCTVSFTLLRDGRSVDLRVDSTSGDAAFDYAALSAVKDAAPFPPLPDGFSEPFLKVHVQFKR